MSEATDLVRELVEGGLNYADVGRALGRDRSLIRQVALGAKPGNNLRDALAGLRERLAGREAPVPVPARRVRSSGQTAAVRRKTRHEGPHHSTVQVKRQAAQHGGTALGRQLARAANEGREAAVTVSFDRRVTVSPYGKRGKAGPGGHVEFKLGDAEAVQAEVDEHYGGNFSLYVAAECAARGLISGPRTTTETVEHMTSLELRTF